MITFSVGEKWVGNDDQIREVMAMNYGWICWWNEAAKRMTLARPGDTVSQFLVTKIREADGTPVHQPKQCPFCGSTHPPKYFDAHVQLCVKNPRNVKAEEPGERRIAITVDPEGVQVYDDPTPDLVAPMALSAAADRKDSIGPVGSRPHGRRDLERRRLSARKR